MISVSEALARVLALAHPPEPEQVALAQAAGRVLLRDATAQRDQPPFDASAMDGYAVCGPVTPGQAFVLVGQSRAGGHYAGTLGPGQAVRIFTGAPIPAGADRVIIQEDVSAGDGRIIVSENLGEGRNIRLAGADFRAGHVVAAPRRLRPVDLALLAAMNCATLTVARKPVIALVATGDELVMPGDTPGPDQIIASNAFALKAMAEAEGAQCRLLPIARDTPEALGDVLTLCDGVDVIVTIGGASVGDHDLVARVMQARGMARSFYNVAMRPGKPLMAGRMGNAAMIGLPGNPVSAIVCGHLFLLPLIRALQGLPDPEPRTQQAIVTTDLAPNAARAHYMRAVLTEGEGLPGITPMPSQDSALLGVLSNAGALLIRPPHDGARKSGEQVSYLTL